MAQSVNFILYQNQVNLKNVQPSEYLDVVVQIFLNGKLYLLEDYINPKAVDTKIQDRYRHIIGVAKAVEQLSERLSYNLEESNLLVLAAALHDIGYSFEYGGKMKEELGGNGVRGVFWHHLNGYLWAKDQGFSETLLILIYGHSFSNYQALFIPVYDEETKRASLMCKKLNEELEEQIAETRSLIGAITFCDMQTNGKGEPVSLKNRFEDIMHRYSEKNEKTEGEFAWLRQYLTQNWIKIENLCENILKKLNQQNCC